MSAVIELIDIRKAYKTGDTMLEVLKGVNMTIETGEMVAIMGASGSGKSTMLNIIGTLDRPSSGTYRLSGINVENMTDDEQSEIRNLKIGFVFQSFFLLPRLTAVQNVMLPLMYRDTPSNEAKARAYEKLEKFNVAHLAEHKPSQMSGGQQQRIALARALVGDPDVLLADEPTGALDTKTSQEVMDVFLHLNQEEKRTLVVVTHDHDVGDECKRIIHVKDGNVVS